MSIFKLPYEKNTDDEPPKKRQKKLFVPEVIEDSSDDDEVLPPSHKKADKHRVKTLPSENSDVEIVSGPSTTKASKARRMPLVTIKKEKGAVHAESSKAAGKRKRAGTEDEESEDKETGGEDNNNNEEEEDSKAGQPQQIRLTGRKAEERVQELAHFGRPQQCEYCRVNNFLGDLKLPSNMKFKIGEDELIGLACQECKARRGKRRCIWFGLSASIPQKDAKFSMAAIRSVRQDNEPVKVVIAEKGKKN